ncbi:glycosyltransferase [Absicoccus intestinalis]|uniref:RecX family transcriptional regulator n=1 Tax=Absicoccus intestinalis TaxID=2926319 RepID=A0ABU4WM32_9FIRM|nr:RecX family transcriptional regulator [Absicoccus sp. CLA-KB-P134]MDX8416532.1 RecX family transcriptional regulator [Absicoccus sp. CLA-KB-P134]
MRIGLFSDAYLPDINGVVSSVATLKGALEKLGHTVFVISNHKGMTIEYDEKNHILHLPGIEWKKMYGYKISSPIQVMGENYIRKMNLDIIHVHTEIGIGLFARQMAKKYNIPLVYTYHTLYEDYVHYVNPREIESVDHTTKRIVRFLSKVAGNGPMAVIAPSNKTKKALMSYGVTTPIYIVPTGIDLSEYKMSNLDPEKIKAVRQSVQIPADHHAVVFVGRIAKEKCIEMPIEALALSKDPLLELVIVGAGTDEKYYHELADTLGVRDRVHFTGKIAKEKIPYYYAAFDCFVSASLSETQGMTYLEALATGLPVFGRRDEVLDGLIDEGVTGYYFDDANELAQKWEVFFSQSTSKRKAMTPLCEAKTKAYDTELFAQKVLAVYQQAMDDYHMAYQVVKIDFLQSDFVQLNVKRKQDEEVIKIKIPDDDFFDLKVSVNTILDAYTVENYINMQSYYESVIKVQRHLSKADYSSYEILQYCQRRLNLDAETSRSIVRNFEDARLINDRQYAMEKALVWHSYGQNKLMIRKKLEKAGIRGELLEQALDQLSDTDEEVNATEMAKRLLKGIKAQSERMMRQSLTNKLIKKGYSVDIAHRVGESIEIDTDENEALKQAVAKAKRLYGNKALDENEKLQKVRLYCMRRGFTASQIENALEEIND